VRTRGGLVLLVGAAGVEAALVRTFAGRGTTWALLVHSLAGAGIALAVAAALGALRGRGGGSAVMWGVGGQIVALLPDLIFAFGGPPKQRWMDVFLGQLSFPLAPAPLLVALGVFLLGGWAWLATRIGRPIAGALLAAATAGLFFGALALAPALPTTVADLLAK